MQGHFKNLMFLLRRSRYLLLGLLAVVFSGVLLAHLNSSTRGTPLKSTPPLRQFGDSAFRLTSVADRDRPFCFSPDGKRLAGANWDEVRIWSFPDGKLLHDFTDRIDSRCIAFSANGEAFLAFEQNEMAIYHFDANTGKLLRKVKPAHVVKVRHKTTYALSADGRWLLSTGGPLTVWNTTTGKQQFRKQPDGMGPLHGTHVSRKGVLTVWDSLFHARYSVETGEQLVRRSIYRRLLDPISNPEGTLMAAYSTKEEAIVFWDPTTEERVGGMIPTKPRSWRPSQGALSGDGQRFVRQNVVFNVLTGAVISRFDSPDAYFGNALVISGDGRFAFPTRGRSVFTPIDTDTGQVYKDTPNHVFGISSLSFTPDGRTLLVGSRDKSQAWDVDTGKPGVVFERCWCRNPYVAAVDNNRALVLGLQHGGFGLRDIYKGDVGQDSLRTTINNLYTFQLGEDRTSLVGIINGRNGRFVRSWEIATGETIAEWSMQDDSDRISEYGRGSHCGLALGGSRLWRFDQVRPSKKLPDGTMDWGRADLLLEDWTTQEVTNRLKVPAKSHFAIAATADCSKLATVVADDWHPNNQRGYGPGSTYLLIWDLETGEEQLRVERQREGYFSSFSCVAISTGGRLVATVSHRSRIEIWNGFTGQLLQRFEANNAVGILVFSDDGTKLASGHHDGSVFLWDTCPAWKLSSPK